MYFPTTLVIALLSSLPQQTSGLDHVNSLNHRNALIRARQSGEDLSFCYSPTSICSESEILFDDCNEFEGQTNLTQWYQCICGNGYVTMDTECDWCLKAYDLPIINDEDDNTSACSQYNGGTIAPVPSSILSVLSAFNATYTGVVSGGSNSGTGSATVASTTKSASPEQTSSSTPPNTRSSSLSSGSISQGGTVTQTLNGGSPGTLTAAPTSNAGGVETSSPSTTLKAGSGTGDAQRWNTGVAVMFSVFACGISVLYLL